jgi:hypothetical protein
MSYESVQCQDNLDSVGVYECEVNLKFRMIEEKGVLQDREQLLNVLLEAFGYGADEYLEAMHVHAEARPLAETDASPELRRQLIRLRNSREFQ